MASDIGGPELSMDGTSLYREDTYTDRKIGIAYGAASSPQDEFAKRIAYLIDENGRIAAANPKVDPRAYPKEQLAAL